MAKTYLNILTFLLTTLVYYVSFKPTLTYNQLSNSEEFKKYTKSNYIYLAVYFLSVMLTQFMLNAYILSSTCGGSVASNLENVGVYTFLPWSLIFGVLMVVLLLYPGFKTAFSDIIGYFYVSNSANSLLSELLVDKNEKPSIDVNKPGTQEEATSSILKILGNPSVLINQMVPTNFNEYWKLLNPLMKPQFKVDSSETTVIKNKLFDLVIMRDNIGEAMWFIYTGMLVIAIVQFNLTKNGCVQDASNMVNKYKKFLEKDEKEQNKNNKSTDKVYTMT